MKKLITLGIVNVLIIGGLFFMPVDEVGGGNGPSPEPCFDMFIDGITFEIKDSGIYNQAGDITIVNGGILKIINSTLNFLCDSNGHQYRIVVVGGSLIMQNSTITTAATPHAQWDPNFEMGFTNANLTMTDYSTLAFPGKLLCTNTLTYINNSWITSVYPTSRFTEPEWATQFPTYMNAVATPWWAGTSVDLTDSTNDGPAIAFWNCKNITVADSRIDAMVEDSTLEAPFTQYFKPTSLIGVTDPVENLTSENGEYVTVRGSPYYNKLTVDSFDVGGYSDYDYVVHSVKCHAVYRTTNDGLGGYNGTDYVRWELDPVIVSSALFQLASNVDRDEKYSKSFWQTPNLAQLAVLNVTFQNLYGGWDNKNDTYFDLIELVVTLQKRYAYYLTMLTVNNSEMSIINTYIGADWNSFNDNFTQKNAIDLQNGAHLYLYNVSMDQDEYDFLNVPPDNPSQYMPYRTEPGCEVYHYKWAKIPVVDEGGGPIMDAAVVATFNFPNQEYIDKVYSMNDLSSGSSASTRILDYLNRTSERIIDAWNYCWTDEYGEVLLPLLCEFINSTCYPNGEHVGNYLINVTYWNGSWFNASAMLNFIPFPNVLPEENLVFMDPIVLSGLTKRSFILEGGCWVLISVPHIQSNTSILAVLSSIEDKWDYVQFYDATDPGSPWKSYSIYRPDSMNDLNQLNLTMGFWLHTTQKCVLTSDGIIPSSTNISLYAGWNLVGYPTVTEGRTISDALWSTGADKVEVCDPTDPYRISEVESTYLMKPGEGYWVHVSTDTIWTVNW